ncbi:MAG: helix-turn-helix transcriptional regulator [Candidatus Korobacteraceae bacterium]
MKHWTQASTGDFAYSISMDFFTQVEDRIDGSGMSRKEFAEKLNVTPSAVSQILNDPPDNPKIESLVKYAHGLGLKVAIVAYDDNDPSNDRGPIFSGIFEESWKRLGSPRDLFDLERTPLQLGYRRLPPQDFYRPVEMLKPSIQVTKGADTISWMLITQPQQIQRPYEVRRPHAA